MAKLSLGSDTFSISPAPRCSLRALSPLAKHSHCTPPICVPTCTVDPPHSSLVFVMTEFCTTIKAEESCGRAPVSRVQGTGFWLWSHFGQASCDSNSTGLDIFPSSRCQTLVWMGASSLPQVCLPFCQKLVAQSPCLSMHGFLMRSLDCNMLPDCSTVSAPHLFPDLVVTHLWHFRCWHLCTPSQPSTLPP